ncbi:MAG: zinc ABC transporter substrate-binding protein [Rhodospirillaceae bacterium]|nr:zinc ABC transporter substrate-binding protein [Rhodospirillaceae bacterium]
MRRARLTSVLALALSATATVSASEPPAVVASIRPVHSLAAGVMGEVGEPALIVRGYGSPHVYQMRPSEARALARADVVLWIGEPLETFLAGPIRNLGESARVLSLLQADGLDLHPVRTSSLWESGHDHEEDDGSADAHIWLAPGNAKAMVDAIARVLGEVDPARADIYVANGTTVKSRIDTMTASIDARLAPVVGVPFVAMHDSMHYFESAFGLHSIGAVTLDPDRQPGAGSVRALSRRLSASSVGCMVTEPQFTPALIEALASEARLTSAQFDPIGIESALAGDSYFAMMTANADSLARCLERGYGASAAP